MKKIIFILGLIAIISPSLFAQSNVLVIDYNNSFSSDQQNNNSIIYNRLLATQTSCVRVASIPAVINPTYDQVWIFGNMGMPIAANLNPVVTYMNQGGAVYVQSEVSCCNNQAAFVDALINATATAGGSVLHTTTLGGYYQTGPSSASPCNPTPPAWVTHGAAIRPFQGTPAVNILFEANNVCGGSVGVGDVVGVKFRACDMISGQGALMSIGDFNVFPTAGTCGTVGILGTPNDLLLIDYLASLFPTLLTCVPVTPSSLVMTGPNDTSICVGDTYPASNFVSNPAGATYTWTNSNPAIGLAGSGTGNLPSFIGTNATGSPITGMVIVIPTSGGCPGTPDTINITINPPPVVNAGLDTTICSGDAVVIGGNPTASGGAGAPYVYSWNPGTALSNTNTANPTATPLVVSTTTYVVQVTDAGGCIGYDSLVVDAISCCAVVIVDTTNVNAKCFGSCDGSISITANGGATQYSIDNGINWQASNTFNNLCAGTYTVLASNGNCSDAITVTIYEPTAISIPNVITDAICYGGSNGQIVVAPQGGTPGYTYFWNFPGVGNSPIASNLPTGTYTVTVTDFNGCTQDSTFFVDQPAPVTAGSFEANILEGCTPLEVEFTNTTSPLVMASFTLDLGNGLISTTSPVTTTYTTPGTYDVTLTIVDFSGCVGVLTKPAYITVYDLPTADFSTWPQRVTVFDPTVNFKDLSQSNIVSWDWNFNNFGGSNLQNPSFTFAEDTATYVVELMVEDNHGCRDTVSHPVRIRGEFGVYVPNAFTPDFDGLNEGFRPDGFGVSEVGYSFLIFDRWGEVVFSSGKKFEPWDGSYKNKFVPNGVYVWSLTFKDLDGLEHKKVGHVTIIR